MLNFVYSSVDRKRFVFKVICRFFFWPATWKKWELRYTRGRYL